MNSSSISTLGFHLAIILAGCGLAYVVMALVKYYRVPLIRQVPIWVYAILMMYLVNFVIQKLGLGDLVDSKTRSSIAGALSDYAIVAAIASMPVLALAQYLVPIVTMIAAGFAVTYALIFGLNRLYFKGDCPVERSLVLWGTSTGVFLTGLLLLKITDPELKLPVMNDYSVAFSLSPIFGFVLMPVTVQCMLTQSFATNMLLQGSLTLLCFLLLIFADRISKTLQRRQGRSQ
jgi:ESS family glutamate:Na+ symporter